jgi:SAM-dependent methyltransferase
VTGHEEVAPSISPCWDACFDVVLLFAVLTCVPGDEAQHRLIAELHRVLRPGGLPFPWLDRAATSVLGFAARRLTGSRIGFLVASRVPFDSFFESSGLTERRLQPPAALPPAVHPRWRERPSPQRRCLRKALDHLRRGPYRAAGGARFTASN